MFHPRYTSSEIDQLGQALYDQQIRDKVDSIDKGKFLVLNIETSEYEIDADELVALRRAKARDPDAPLYILRIGYATAYRLGGKSVAAGQ